MWQRTGDWQAKTSPAERESQQIKLNTGGVWKGKDSDEVGGWKGGEVNATGRRKLKGPDRPGIKASVCACMCVYVYTCVFGCEWVREGRVIKGRGSEWERLTLYIQSHPLTAHSNKWILTASKRARKGWTGRGGERRRDGDGAEAGERALKGGAVPL